MSTKPSLAPQFASKVLWVVPKWPFPAQDGARIATVNLLRGLTRLGMKADLLAVAAEDEACDFVEAVSKLGVEHCHVIRRKGASKKRLRTAMQMGSSLLKQPRVPLTMGYFSSPAIRRQFDALLARGYGAIVYDGLHTAIHSSRGGSFVRAEGMPQVIYRAHNCEWDIWNRKAVKEPNAAKRLLLRDQARRVRKFERSLCGSADAVMTVSREDLVLFEAAEPTLRGGVAPIGYEFGPVPPLPRSESLQLMFLGKMDWHPNRDGLAWFLKEVWPTVAERRADLTLAIAGSGNSDWIKPYLGLPRVRFLGRVESVEALYEESALSLVPVFYGSGTRVKVIEASRFGRACLSTAIGVEGVGLSAGKSYLHVESAEEWIRELTELKRARLETVGSAAYQAVRERFDDQAAAREFLRVWGAE